MKSRLFVLILLSSFQSSIILAATNPRCKDLIVKISGSKEAKKFQWRQNQTYGVKPGEFVASNATREQEIKGTVTDMESDINNSSTPAIIFNSAPGIALQDLGDGPTDHYGQAQSFLVTGLKKTNGVLYGSVMLPVSGHADSSKINLWAQQDTLNLYYLDDAGKQHDILVKQKSLGLVTVAEIAIPLQPGKQVSLQYFRDGSAGVWGFPSGRIIQFKWDGN